MSASFVDPASELTLESYLALPDQERNRILAEAIVRNESAVYEACQQLQVDWLLYAGSEIVASGMWSNILSHDQLTGFAQRYNRPVYLAALVQDNSECGLIFSTV